MPDLLTKDKPKSVVLTPLPVSRRDSYGRTVLSYHDIVETAAALWEFAQRARLSRVGAAEIREAVRRILNVYGRGYVVEYPLPGHDRPDVRFDIAEANERFHSVSVHARQMHLLSPGEILKLRAECWHDVVHGDERERAFERDAAGKRRGSGGDLGLEILEAGTRPPLAQSLLEAVKIMREHAFKRAFPTASELFRVADGLAMLLLDTLGMAGLERLSKEKLCEAAVRAYAILSRAEYQARMLVRRGSLDDWHLLIERRGNLRRAILAARPHPSVFASTLSEDLRLFLDLRGPQGLADMFKNNTIGLETMVAAMSHFAAKEVAETYGLILRDKVVVKHGLQDAVANNFNRLVAKLRPDCDAIMSLLASEEIAARAEVPEPAPRLRSHA